MNYRSLKKEEIGLLVSQGCFADKWSDITVKDNFLSGNIRNTRFEGEIKLGVFNGIIETETGISTKCGIYNSYIRNCEIGNNVFISDAKQIANYVIEDNVTIENAGSLAVTGESYFGNGTEVEVLNEGGGRELPIFDRLSSQIAYLVVLYRHDKIFTKKLVEMIRDYCESKRSGLGRIASGSRIKNSLVIRNVSVGGYTTISGTSLLEEGTIISCKEAPTFIGEGVIAKKFIILSGSRVDSGAIIDKSFVGQGVKMGKQFSSENSLFFANCEAFHGEACSIFAGPFTVTHHKSTLMIASLFSFFNAGSGTNQSNHMYKLGPVHQGILDRGSKTGSFAYLLLPCFIGAFTVVMGKHYSNFDAADFPFSYITEEKGKSELTPAMNLFTVGTRRDSEKWPARDIRRDPDKLDLIHFDLFSPYIVGRILNGITILKELAEKTPKTQDWINYKGINIHRLLLKTARKYYEMALKVYIGQEIVKRIEVINSNSTTGEIRKLLKTDGKEGRGKWIEISGLFSPASKIEELINSVKSGNIKSIPELNKNLMDIYNNYDKYAWEWCANLADLQTGTDSDNIFADKLIGIIGDWKTNAVKLNNMILKDAEKEFDPASKLGFGIDGDEQTKELDFKAVRGVYDENKFVTSLKNEIRDIEEKGDRLITLLEKIY
jgi:NDP-sugar pyrophosphorylase family protein